MDELKQMIFTIFNTQVKDADFYKHNDSTWLIFTNKKKWVFELTEEGTLWYNYYFFKNFFELLSLDVIENQNYITEWVEYTIQNVVKHTRNGFEYRPISVEETIQNGVKETKHNPIEDSLAMEEVIQNGVGKTRYLTHQAVRYVEDTIQNGVKYTRHRRHHPPGHVEDTIQNGVKETNWKRVDNHPTYLDKIIKSSN